MRRASGVGYRPAQVWVIGFDAMRHRLARSSLRRPLAWGCPDRVNENGPGKTSPARHERRYRESCRELEAERHPHEQIVSVDIRTQGGAPEDVVPERELRAKRRSPSLSRSHHSSLDQR